MSGPRSGSTPELLSSQTPGERAECRLLAVAFRFAHDLLRTPDATQWGWLHHAATGELWRRLTAAVELDAGEAPDLPADAEEYASEFIAAFEVGTPNPPVPLIESHYNRRDPVPRILHENILFHRAFGLQLRDSSAETADHLRHQLEFVAWLLDLEAELPEDDAAAGRRTQLRQGRHDFVARHLLSWLPRALEKAEGAPRRWTPDYLALIARLAETAGADRA